MSLIQQNSIMILLKREWGSFTRRMATEPSITEKTAYLQWKVKAEALGIICHSMIYLIAAKLELACPNPLRFSE